MKSILKHIVKLLVLIFLSVNATCVAQKSSVSGKKNKIEKKRKKRRKKAKLPKIDLTHWKVTIPEGNDKGKPYEVSPPEIFDYANNDVLKKYMYNDSARGALVFYAEPNITTANTKYSRSELREQMKPGDNNVNWTFKQGGRMKGKLAIDEISKNEKGEYHKTIIMQIHGRLTNEQKELIGQKDNNAPPILKIYWKNGKVRVKTKILKNKTATYKELLHKDAWDDDEGYTFKQKVGFKKFTLEVKVSDGKMVVILNNNEFKVYENIHMKRWGIFENYFKAGNYFQTRDKDAFARVRFYKLEVSH
ncbi:polysaccharide lyase family 7 protein [Tenacibaculum jejuense]|uniref:Putative alginate lyase, family PL7 n=1 Tax=Tenacibaculum jejuense TaxID=584609 RepID=A0A238UAF3_9FLAO|nr:polysaccharide lyase family 7 protein [Tenacibaculum jejuense]SNR16173.1 Putative alginate lyase precursor, family PL7 [Tenacibaculum jejuense]